MSIIRTKFVMGNWKMHGNLASIDSLLSELAAGFPSDSKAKCVVFPPSIYLSHVSESLKLSQIFLGAQNIYPADYGAYTGEISLPMLADFDCRFVLVGHSERRHMFHEDVKMIAEKFHQVKDHGMMPVLCVGETLQERNQGLTQDVLIQQLSAVSLRGKDCFSGCVIAYEPVWAIGTGQTPDAQDVQLAHLAIRSFVALTEPENAEKLSVIYGGSVNEKNAELFFSLPDVDGGLIGGASLNAQSFLEIVKCIN